MKVYALLNFIYAGVIFVAVYGADLIDTEREPSQAKKHRSEATPTSFYTVTFRVANGIFSNDYIYSSLTLHKTSIITNDDTNPTRAYEELRGVAQQTFTLPPEYSYVFKSPDITQLLTGIIQLDGTYLPGALLSIDDLIAFGQTSRGNYIAVQKVFNAFCSWRDSALDPFFFRFNTKQDLFRQRFSSKELTHNDLKFLGLLKIDLGLDTGRFLAALLKALILSLPEHPKDREMENARRIPRKCLKTGATITGHSEFWLPGLTFPKNTRIVPDTFYIKRDRGLLEDVRNSAPRDRYPLN